MQQIDIYDTGAGKPTYDFIIDFIVDKLDSLQT